MAQAFPNDNINDVVYVDDDANNGAIDEEDDIQDNLAGSVIQYDLPEFSGAMVFDPITYCAINNVTQNAAMLLNEEQLIKFLCESFDERIRSFRQVVRGFTDHVEGLCMQLKELEERIEVIQRAEKEKTEFIIKRIQVIQKVLKNQRKSNPPRYNRNLPLSSAAREALLVVCPANNQEQPPSRAQQNPLSSHQLLTLIKDGDVQAFNGIATRDQLINQLQHFHSQIKEHNNFAKHQIKYPTQKLLTAIKKIRESLLTE